MLCKHGWEKQQTQRPKGSGPKRVMQRNPPKEILPWVKRTISKAYGWTKYIEIKHAICKQE